MASCSYEFVKYSKILDSLYSLSRVLSETFGPGLGKVIMTKENGEVAVTNDGSSILSAVAMHHPLSRLITDGCRKHHKQCGNNAKSCFLLVHAALTCYSNIYENHDSLQRQKIIKGFDWFKNSILLNKNFCAYIHEYLSSSQVLSEDNQEIQSAYSNIIKGCLSGKHAVNAVDVLTKLICNLLQHCNSFSKLYASVQHILNRFDSIVFEVPGVSLQHSAVYEGVFIQKPLPKVFLIKETNICKVLVVSFDDAVVPSSQWTFNSTKDFDLKYVLYTKHLVSWLEECIKLNIALIFCHGKPSETFRSLCERYDIGLIDCLLLEDINYICFVLNILPLCDATEQLKEQYIANVALTEIYIANQVFIQVKLTKKTASTLIISSPSNGLCSQYKASIYNALLVLKHWMCGCEGPMKDMQDQTEVLTVCGGGMFFVALHKLLADFDLVKSIVNEPFWSTKEAIMFNCIWKIVSEMLLIVPKTLHQNWQATEDSASRFILYQHQLDKNCSTLEHHSDGVSLNPTIVEPLHCQLNLLNNAINLFIQVLRIDIIASVKSIHTKKSDSEEDTDDE